MNKKRHSKSRAIAGRVWSAYKHASIKMGRSFEITPEDAQSIIFKKCAYCGRPPSNKLTYEGSKILYNGMDRKDSNLGYFVENIVPCCFRCNQAKSNMSSEHFLELARTIVRNNEIKNDISVKKLNQYYERALAVSMASPDPSTKVGALLIHGESGAVIADGYNGFIRGARDDLIPKTRPEKYDYIIHAETNLLCNSARHGVSTDKCVIFCTISPCIKCMRSLFQAGIKEVYVKGFYSDFQQCASMLDLKLTVTTIGDFSRITMNPKKDQ